MTNRVTVSVLNFLVPLGNTTPTSNEFQDVTKTIKVLVQNTSCFDKIEILDAEFISRSEEILRFGFHLPGVPGVEQLVEIA